MGAVYLIRHGQTSFGKADYDKLSELGVEQSQVLGRSLRARLPMMADLAFESGKSKTSLVFTSGGPITAICQHLLQIPDVHVFALNRTLANAAITKIIYGEQGLHLSTVNEHAHFEGVHRELLTYR